MNEKKQWGGRRKGAGRPPVLQEPVKVTVWLEAAQLEWIEAMGDRGEVIRRLIDEAKRAVTQ